MNVHRPWLMIVPAFALGIAVQTLYPFPVSFVSTFFLIFWTSCFVFRRRLFLLFLWPVLFLLLGALYAESFQINTRDGFDALMRYQKHQDVTARGRIVSEVQYKESIYGTKTTFDFKIRQVKIKTKWKAANSLIRVQLFRKEPLRYGDEIQMKGRCHRPYNFETKGRFSYRQFLKHRGIKWICSIKKETQIEMIARGRGFFFKACSLNFKRSLLAALDKYLTKNESALMQAMLLGNRGQTPQRIKDIFAQTGTAHILAISGLHVGIMASLFLILLRIIPAPRAFQFSLLIIVLVFYVFMTGGRPSVVRAAVMTSVFLFGLIIEKEQDLLNTLTGTAFILLLINPFYLFDIGFQLSFMCVLSIISLTSKIEKIMRKVFKGPEGRCRNFLIRSLSCSFAVWFGVSGLIAYYFHIIVPVTVIANLIAIPCISVILVLGFGLLFMAFVFPSAAALFAVCLTLALNFMVGALFLLSQIPGAYIWV